MLAYRSPYRIRGINLKAVYPQSCKIIFSKPLHKAIIPCMKPAKLIIFFYFLLDFFRHINKIPQKINY